MSAPKNTVLKIVPSAESLAGKQEMRCSVEECTSTFRNVSNLNMHLTKHHKFNVVKPSDPNAIVQYFCPEEKCRYNVNEHPRATHFKTLKYLRQHYLKMHADRTFGCQKCSKAFASSALLGVHVRMCGQKFECIECGWSYDTRECLLTHCRRKGHAAPEQPKKRKTEAFLSSKQSPGMSVKKNSRPVAIAPKSSEMDPIWEESTALRIRANFNCLLKKRKSREKVTQETQTSAAPTSVKVSKATGASVKQKSVAVGTTSTEISYRYKNLDMTDEESNTNLSDQGQSYRNLNNLTYIEDDSSLNYFTVGNFNSGLCHIETQTELALSHKSPVGARETDPLLCHMQTQTNDDILSEFGLSDIQTQTYWPNDDYNDLCVSTETQTCLQHLIDNISTETQTPASLPI